MSICLAIGLIGTYLFVVAKIVKIFGNYKQNSEKVKPESVIIKEPRKQAPRTLRFEE